MPNASSLTPDERFVALFVGPKHSGKTVAACSFISKNPNLPRTRVFDFDNRIRGILGASWIDKTKIDYDYYPPRQPSSSSSTFERLNTDFEILLSECNNRKNPYGLIILDSLTSETFALVCDALPLTHPDGKKGKFLGKMAMAGPEDYGYEAQGTYQILAFLRSLPGVNVIVTAHVVDKYAKPEFTKPNGETYIDPYSESVVVGEKLSVRDKIGTNASIYFDHIFRFNRRMNGPNENFYVQFRGDIACTSYPGLPSGNIDITNKPCCEVMQGFVSKSQE